MYVQVGTYPTPNNSAWNVISVRTNVSPRGRIISQTHVWEVHCVLGAGSSLTQGALTTLINQHIAGMKQNNVDMVFYEDDGTETAHKIVASQTAGGITYLGHSFPGYFRGMWGAGSEYAEGAAIRYVVTRHTAEVFDVEDGLLYYQQSTKYSTGGFDYQVPGALSGPPQYQITMLQAPFWGIQQGSAVGMFSRPNAPTCLFGIQPKPRKSFVQPITPKNQARRVNSAYGIAWFYYVESPGALTVAPPDTL